MALTTLADVKLWLGVTGTELDAKIAALIPRAQAGIENYLQRTIEPTQHTELRNGTGGRLMMLRDYPVQSVQSVAVDGRAVPQSAGIGTPGWRLAERVIVLEDYRFTRGEMNVQLVYTAGYATVPGDIAQACIEIVGLLLKRPDHVDVSSKTLAGETIAYLTADMTPSAKAAMGSYRRVAPLL